MDSKSDQDVVQLDSGISEVGVVDDDKLEKHMEELFGNYNLEEFLDESQDKVIQCLDSANKVLLGQEDVNKQILAAIASGGHVSLVGVPGTGKSRLFENLGVILGLRTGRVQFTPDLTPADILGGDILQTMDDGTRTFMPEFGPIFDGELCFGDEINRAVPRTQAAFMQAMQEKMVSLGKGKYPLPMIFSVVATRNPLEQEGTYPLPEAQLDRFTVEINLGYAARKFEDQFTQDATQGSVSKALETWKKRISDGWEAVLKREHGENHVFQDPVLDKGQLVEIQQLISAMPIGKTSFDRIGDLVHRLRKNSEMEEKDLTSHLEFGPGPRARIAFIRAAKAHAFSSGRLTIEKEDIKALSQSVLGHRMKLNQRARYGSSGDKVTIPKLIDEALDRTLD